MEIALCCTCGRWKMALKYALGESHSELHFARRDLPTGGMSEQSEVVELPMVRTKLVSHRRSFHGRTLLYLSTVSLQIYIGKFTFPRWLFLLVRLSFSIRWMTMRHRYHRRRNRRFEISSRIPYCIKKQKKNRKNENRWNSYLHRLCCHVVPKSP